MRLKPLATEASTADGQLVALQNLAVAQMGQFDYNKAAESYQRLLKQDPASAQYQVDLAIALLNRRLDGDLVRSAKLLDALLDTPDDTPDGTLQGAASENLRARYCRALLCFNDGQTDKAQELFEIVADRDPTDSYAIYYVGQSHLMRGEYAAALAQFKQAQQIDPYLRSAYYGAFQAAQRLKDAAAARQHLETFQRLENNPRSRLAELKYTRMGPKAEVRKPRSNVVPVEQPSGPLFAEVATLSIEDASAIEWNSTALNSKPSVTIADIDSDGKHDLFVTNGQLGSNGKTQNLVLLSRGAEYERQPNCPLENVPDVNTALWGDYDNDGYADVYLCRRGKNQLWRQTSPGIWLDVTDKTKTGAGEADTVDGACYDADHDGDLDYLLVNADKPCELLNNNRDGTFRPLADEIGLAVDNRSSRRVMVADLDQDDDADVILLNEGQPHTVLLNDRLWKYHAAKGFQRFAESPCTTGVAVDANVDGQVEIYTFGSDRLLRWQPSESGEWTSQQIAQISSTDAAVVSSLDMQDFDGDTELEIALHVGNEIRLLELDGTERMVLEHEKLSGFVTSVIGQAGAELIGLCSGGPPLIWKAGSGRKNYAIVHLSGRIDKAAEMRSNASGIGVRGAARIGNRWSPISPWRPNSGPGQSLQPQAIGLDGADKIDFIQLVWPDGVSQTELNLAAGTNHRIAETQRQAGSCPLVFAWNGQKYEFIADILGAGGIGFNLGKGEYYEPRPTENLLIPADRIKPQQGRIVVKLGEPMEEICYFDALRLSTYDLPPNCQMALDERFGGSDPQPTGAPWYFRKELVPVHVINDRNENITAALTTTDKQAAPLARTDRRFVGLTNPHELTLTFSQPLNELNNPVFVFDGWVEYAYSQTAFAAWQAGVSYLEPTIEAKGQQGQWHVVVERFGYMAGTPRRSSVPIPREKLPPGARQLRVSTNMQIYWDRISVVDAAPEESVAQQQLTLCTAIVDDVGFSSRSLLDQRYPIYDYENRPPFGSARHPRGFYTAFGNARELVEATDDAVAIIGPGEELHLEFSEPKVALQPGWSRYYVLQADGWCKDSDSFTKDSRKIEPLPTRGLPTTEQERKLREKLHTKYNTRYRSGW